MPQSRARVLIQVGFSTKDRKAWIHPGIEADLFADLAATLKVLGSPALLVGGTDERDQSERSANALHTPSLGVTLV